MARSSEFDPLAMPCLHDIEEIVGRYLRDGLDPAHVLSALAVVAIKTAQADPRYKQLYLDYFAAVVRGAGDVTITEE